MSQVVRKREAQCPVCGPDFVASTRGVRHHWTSVHGGDSSKIVFVMNPPKNRRRGTRVYSKALTKKALHR